MSVASLYTFCHKSESACAWMKTNIDNKRWMKKKPLQMCWNRKRNAIWLLYHTEQSDCSMLRSVLCLSMFSLQISTSATIDETSWTDNQSVSGLQPVKCLSRPSFDFWSWNNEILSCESMKKYVFHEEILNIFR